MKMSVNEYRDGDEIKLLDWSKAARFEFGWAEGMNKLVGQIVVPLGVFRNDAGVITDFKIADISNARGWWHWDPHYVELVTSDEDTISAEDFSSILN